VNVDTWDRGRLTAAVGLARRRFLANQALREAALGTAIVLLGPALLLVLGRDILAGPWLAMFGLAGLGTAAWRWWRGRLDLYRVSQILDARLSTQDQISTAICFLGHSSPVAVEQRRASTELAERLAVEAAFPFTLHRSMQLLAAAFLLASVLGVLRYVLEKPLEMRQSLPGLIARAMGVDQAQAKDQPAPKDRAGQRQQANVLPYQDKQGWQPAPLEPADESPADGNGAEGQGPAPEPGRSGADRPDKEGEFGAPVGSSPEGDPIQSYEDMLERDAQSGLSMADGKQGNNGQQEASQREKSGIPEEPNSLLSKLREAMNQMMSKLQQKAPGSGNLQQAAAGSKGNGGEQQPGEGDGQTGAGQGQPSGQESQGEGTPGNSQDSSDPSNSGGTTKNSGSQGARGSGAGSQDGDKRMRENEQQEAFGKLSELYGRRASGMTGEITIEALPGKQTLRTPQVQKGALHRDIGGEISRDEIPLAFQPYVKEYFTKLRQAPKK